jgi:hypothetical protein
MPINFIIGNRVIFAELLVAQPVKKFSGFYG